MSRLLAVLTLLAMLLSPLTQVPHVARAQNGGIDGTTYTDDAYGFVVEWPKNTYEASVQEYEDGTPYGLRLGFDGGFGLVGGLAHDDAEACLDAPTEVIRDLDGVTKFRETSQYDTEGLTRDLESRFVTYTYQPEGQLKANTHANFFGCEPMMQGGELVDGVFLYFEFGDTTADFEDNFTAFIDIMNGVTFGGDSGTNNDDSGDLGQVRADTDDADATDDTSDDSGSTDATDAESTDRDANGIADTSYVDPTYGFGVSYAADADPEVAEDTDGNQIGVVFGSDFATFVRWWSGSSARTCVNEYVSLFEGEAVDGEISEADDLDMPDSPDAERATLVRFDYVADADADPVSWLVYVECRQMVQDGEPVEDVFLSVTAVVVEDGWDDAIAPLSDILGTITFDAKADSASDDASTDDSEEADSDLPADGIGETEYIDPVFSFGVAYPKGSNPEVALNDDDVQVGVSFGDGYNIQVRSAEATTSRRCVNDVIAMWSDLDSDGEAEPSDTLTPPNSPDAERSAVVEVNYETDAGDAVDFGGYVECRAMIQDGEEVDDTWLAVTFLTTTETWDDTIPALEDVLDSIAFDAEASTDTDATDSDADTDSDTDTDSETDTDGTSGIDGSTYTSAIGYAISWDDALLTGDLLDSENPDAGLVLAGTGAFLQFQAFADPTLEDCLNAELNSVSNLDGMGTLRTAPSADSLEPGAGSESAFKKATLELSNGPIDVFVYVECRPLGTEIDGNPMALVIRFIIVQDAYSDLQDPLQELLDGITLTN